MRGHAYVYTKMRCASLSITSVYSSAFTGKGSTGNRLKMIASDQAFIKLLSTIACFAQ